MKARTLARTIVLQALYELDFTQHSFSQVIAKRIQDDAESLSPRGVEFANILGRGVIENIDELDALTAQFAPDWPLDQMASIDRNILRIAIYELLFQKETPGKVVANEAVELAKHFGSDATPAFVNGVIGTIMAQQTQ